MALPRNISDEKLMDICSHFLKHRNATATRDYCNKLWEEQDSPYRISRSQVYAGFERAIELNYFALSPPYNVALPNKIADGFGHLASDIKVVECRDDLDAIAEATANVTMKLIEILDAKHQKKKRVHLGMGAGRTTSLVARHLAAALRRSENPIPPLTIHALSSGFDVYDSYKAPLSFFSLFEGLALDIEYVGLFSSASVETSRYEEAKREPGVAKAFAAKKDIDIVITSLASAKDPHGDLRRFLQNTKQKKGQGNWVGDVQYRPYSAKGPVTNQARRAVTLFELDELREMAAKRDKHVVLVAGPCGGCLRPRTDALLPLVQNPDLKVWSHLVLDIETGRQLANLAPAVT